MNIMVCSSKGGVWANYKNVKVLDLETYLPLSFILVCRFHNFRSIYALK